MPKRRSFHSLRVYVRLAHPLHWVPFIAGLCVLAVMIADHYKLLPFPVSVTTTTLRVVIVPFVVVAGIGETCRWRNIRSMQRVGLREFCRHCRYDLSALEDEDICPECGRPYTKADNEAYWAPIRGYGRLTRCAGQYFRHVLRTRPRQNP